MEMKAEVRNPLRHGARAETEKLSDVRRQDEEEDEMDESRCVLVEI